MLIVTGASGQLGRTIVEHLARRIEPSGIGVSVRDPTKAAALTALGVRVRAGDFARPESLVHAFEGASAVLLVSSNARAYGGDPLAQHRAAITAARDAGARRILYTSHMAASPTSVFPPMHDHVATEDMLRDAGVAWTALRNGFYAASAVAFLAEALRSDTLEAPADGRVHWTTHADLAEAAAILLSGARTFEGPTPPLVGGHALDLAELTTITAKLRGVAVTRRVIDDEAFAAKLAARGLPAGAAAIALGFYRASRRGEFVAEDATLASLLGRPPQTVDTVITAALGG